MERRELQTPCFIFDESNFVNNVKCFDARLRTSFPKHIIGYSFKTNSLPRLLYIAKENGCYAEVVSDDEFRLALKIGYDANHIIYNGPVKGHDSFIYAVENGSIVNIDSKRELEWLRECNLSKTVNIGIRVNFDLERKVPGQTSTRESGGRFGFRYENGELSWAIASLKKLGINILCLHMHVSNASKSIDVYKALGLMACEIVKKEKLDLDYIDFGGGYFGGGDNGEEYEKYIEVFKSILFHNDLDKLGVIVEPGASVIATSFSYLTKVVDIKDTIYGRFVITDGSRLDIDPFMVKKCYNYKLTTNNQEIKNSQIVCGYTCMEKDRIMSISKEKELKVSDYIEYRTVGSYTMCFNNLFISFFPNVYSINESSYFLVREKWDVEEFLQKNRWIL